MTWNGPTPREFSHIFKTGAPRNVCSTLYQTSSSRCHSSRSTSVIWQTFAPKVGQGLDIHAPGVQQKALVVAEKVHDGLGLGGGGRLTGEHVLPQPACDELLREAHRIQRLLIRTRSLALDLHQPDQGIRLLRDDRLLGALNVVDNCLGRRYSPTAR
jgi:hypothetical protein